MSQRRIYLSLCFAATVVAGAQTQFQVGAPSNLRGSARELQASSLLSSPESYDVTLVTVASLNRLPVVQLLASKWTGPMVAVCFSEGRHQEEKPSWQKELENSNGNLVIDLVHSDVGGSLDNIQVNALRNRGIRAVRTSHMFLVDVDFQPNPGAYEQIMRYMRLFPNLFSNPKMAFVAPAFSLEDGECSEVGECVQMFRDSLPVSKEHLGQMVADGHVKQFGTDAVSHSSTGYNEWFAQAPDEMRLIPCLHSVRYEPYFVNMMSPDLPSFDERFTGYGKNKIQWDTHLRYLGWEYSVMPDVFLTHLTHPFSTARNVWNMGEHRKIMDHLFLNFVEELHDSVVLQPDMPCKRLHLCGWADATSVY